VTGAPGEVGHLDVEGEAGGVELGEELAGHWPPEELEAALRVPDSGQERVRSRRRLHRRAR